MSIFPFISPESLPVSGQDEALPEFREYAYDYQQNKLKLKNGRPYLIERNEALKVWIFKALHTSRFRHVAYSTSFGHEIESIMGRVMESGILNSEVRRFIIEALMVNPYIQELSNFQFVREGSRLTVIFDCITVYGEMTQKLQLEEVA